MFKCGGMTSISRERKRDKVFTRATWGEAAQGHTAPGPR